MLGPQIVDFVQTGIWAGQDHGSANVEARAQLRLVRVLSRDPATEVTAGRYHIDPKTYGDLLGLGVWQVAGSSRQLAAWMGAWPVVVIGGSTLPILAPVRTAGWAHDTRFRAETGGLPPFAGPMPRGWGAVRLHATREDQQDNVVIPGFYGLVAPHRAEQWQTGTRVYDLAAGAPGVYSELQSLVRVVRPRGTDWSSSGSENALALVASRSGLADDRSGYLLCYFGEGAYATIDPKLINIIPGSRPGGSSSWAGWDYLQPAMGSSGTVVAGALPPGVVGAGSYLRGGPTVVPQDCQHRRGTTADGELIIPEHKHTRLIWFSGGIWDCPLDFEETFEPAEVREPVQGWPWRVHLQVDGRAKHQTPEPKPGDTLGRWHVRLPIGTSQPPKRPPQGETIDIFPAAVKGSVAAQGRLAVGTAREWVASSFVLRPQPVVDIDLDHEDGRYLDMTPEQQAAWEKRPYVLRIDAVGHEQGGGDFETEDPQGDLDRYPDGSSFTTGGLQISPPQTGHEDNVDGIPSDLSLPTDYVVALYRVALGLGLIDPTTGKLASGWSVQRNPSTERLEVYKADSAGTQTLRLSKTDDGLLMRHEGSTPDQVRVGLEVGRWGDGSDGDKTLTSDETLSSGVYQYADLDLAGYTLSPSESEYGWLIIYVSGNLTFSGGSISVTGKGQQGSSGATGATAGGAGPGGVSSLTDPGGLTLVSVGGAGGGGGAAGDGSGTAGGDTSPRNGKILDGSGNSSGGAGGTASGNGSSASAISALGANYTRTIRGLDAILARYQGFGGAGAGGGAGHSEDATNGGTGSDGAAGAGYVGVFARRAETSSSGSTIEADGEDASVGGDGAGGGGGGGGGGAGMAIFVCGECDQAVTGSTSASVTFGSGLSVSAQAGSGGSGAAGSVSSGGDGADGEDGRAFVEIYGTT